MRPRDERVRRGPPGGAVGATTAQVLVLGLVAILGIGPGCDRDSKRDDPCGPPSQGGIALLSVGDFGQPPSWFPLLGRREAVSRAIDREHACRPAAALLLLGDNFYPNGLTDENFETRVRDTVVAPLCRFLSLTGEYGERLATSCSIPPDDRRPVPILAVMGNHDYEPPFDGRLQKEQLPRWIPEWQMPQQLARVFEVPTEAGGISVIAIDSVALHEGADFGPVRDALERARGRYRILIAHHPLTVGGQSFEVRYAEGILRAIRESGRRVHLLLAGHEHHLALSETGRADLPLQAVVGSGARVRAASHVLLGGAERWQRLGFARLTIERMGTGAETDTLTIELFAVSRWDHLLGRRPELVARRRITQAGNVLRSVTQPSGSTTISE